MLLGFPGNISIKLYIEINILFPSVIIILTLLDEHTTYQNHKIYSLYFNHFQQPKQFQPGLEELCCGLPNKVEN